MKKMLAVLCLAWLPGGALAQDRMVSFSGVSDGEWRLGVSDQQWIETRLPLFPKNAIEGNLRPRDSYMTTVIVSRELGAMTLNFGRLLDDVRFGIEAEGTYSQHRGLQDHEEITVGLMLRAPEWETSVGDFGLGWANGLSYALSEPDWERGPGGVRGVDSVKTQYYMGFEATYAPAGSETIEIFGRLHHRSGIYGVISPSNTGSNHLGMGLRLKF